MYKSQLQEYAQKAAIPPPVYEFVKEGASHEPRFKAIVILNNVTYESPPGFPNLKAAEHAAARVALDGLLRSSGGTGVVPSPVHESGLCKNLLQEYAQKNSLPLPVYQSQRSGEDHAPTFTSSVEIAGVKYSGGFAKNKKEAEIKAARTALLAIQSTQSPVVPAPQPHVATAPGAPVGLSTLISTHINNAPGKKRGRGAADAIPDEPGAGRLKTGPHTAQGHVEVSKGVTETGSPGQIEDVVNLVTESVPEVQDPSIVSSVAPSVVTPDMFATPGAKKILGETPLTPPISTTLEPSLDVQRITASRTPEAPQSPRAIHVPEMQQSPQPFQVPEVQETPQILQAPHTQERPQPLQAPQAQQSPQPLQAPQAQQSPQPLQAPQIQQSPETMQAPQTLLNSQILPTDPDSLVIETSAVLPGVETADIPLPQILKKESTFIVTNFATGAGEEIVVTQEVLAVDAVPDLHTAAQIPAEIDHGAAEVQG